MNKFLNATALSVALTIGALGTAEARSIDLGFIVDESGSVGQANFTNVMQSLGTAITSALTPTLGGPDTYTVSVVAFSSTARDVITRTVTSATDLALIENALNTAAGQYAGQQTVFANAFDELADNFTTLGDFSLINMTTDGNEVRSNVSEAQLNANSRAARDSLAAAGWDSLSFEVVGNGVDTTFPRELAFDTQTGANLNTLEPLLGNAGDIDNPLTDSFVLQISDFDQYDPAISAKVQEIVDIDPIPLPAPAFLLLAGLGGLVAVRKSKTA